MSGKSILRMLGALILSGAGGNAWAVNLPQPPNYVVIVVDDLNDWVGCLEGHPQVRTPHIDRLAQRGMLFTNAHVQATFCVPSRISFLSGRMPSTTGCYEFEAHYHQAKYFTREPAGGGWRTAGKS